MSMSMTTQANKFIISRNLLKCSDIGFIPIKVTLYDILSNNHPSNLHFKVYCKDYILIEFIDDDDMYYLYKVYESDINDINVDINDDNADIYIQEIKNLHQGIYRKMQISKL